jgi:hypothetical protein
MFIRFFQSKFQVRVKENQEREKCLWRFLEGIQQFVMYRELSCEWVNYEGVEKIEDGRVTQEI